MNLYKTFKKSESIIEKHNSGKYRIRKEISHEI